MAVVIAPGATVLQLYFQPACPVRVFFARTLAEYRHFSAAQPFAGAHGFSTK
ncbi:hypothetical protein JZM21_27645 [Escherichia coli]|uniref:hypothetical protein n=1 Tax=Escherichia coli TaxID=562 RepID=UPI000A851BA3|nr:hypothetical protein [Escherichia coli]MBN6378263.1 hypothetical protein [Escherichia coli]HAW0837569.1 hypothetical protein [Escherichia coli]